ncbi:MAG: hypothetical protein JWR35_3721 [Marmoricola sp.]|nr:hypothetical protein [Marmoricola sp.]
MVTDKILSTLADNPGVGVTQLCELTGANRRTVLSVLQRHRNALTARPAPSEGARGRPEHLYEVKPEWISVLRERWAPPRAEDPLESALAILESASFAARDVMETPEDRERMAGVTHLRARAARRLIEAVETSRQAAALARVERAEARLTREVRVEPRPIESPGQDVLEAWGSRWAQRLGKLIGQYGSDVPGMGDIGTRGIALVLNCISGPSSASGAFATILRASHRPTLSLHLAALSVSKRAAFVREFETLALDPIARASDLYVTVDSRQSQSTATWAQIDEVGHADRAARAVEIAGYALMEAVKDSGGEAVEPAIEYQTHFIADVMKARDEPTLWQVYGSPHVLDLGRNAALQATVEGQSWIYHSRVDVTDMNQIAGEANWSGVREPSVA